MSNIFNSELTKEEVEKIETATNDIGKFGSVEIVKSNGVIDIVKSERIRIRGGKDKSNYNKG